jgi:hypothetical protein
VKASSLIGREFAHKTDHKISGRVTDLLFGPSLDEVAFFLVEVTGEA